MEMMKQVVNSWKNIKWFKQGVEVSLRMKSHNLSPGEK